MAVVLEKLYQKAKDYDLELVAGQMGLNHVVSWFHVMEGAQLKEFVETETVAFTTGIALSSTEELIELVKIQCEKKASGTILNIGPYISEVPQELIDYCNEQNYPLFVVPWDVSLPHIMKLFSYMILESEKAGVELGSALKSAISFPQKTNLYAPVFNQYGFYDEADYCMVVMKPDNSQQEPSREMIQKMVKCVEHILMSYGDKSFIINSEGVFLLLFQEYSREEIQKIINKILSSLKESWKNIYVGIGNILSGFTNISKSHVQALKVLRFNEKRHVSNVPVEYRELGLYKLLLAIDDHSILKEYYQDSLGILKHYDEIHHSDYLKVLEIYLYTNGSLNETANRLFIHRNTVNYKIRRIQEMLKCDLSDTEVRSRLYVAFCVGEILE